MNTNDFFRLTAISIILTFLIINGVMGYFVIPHMTTYLEGQQFQKIEFRMP